MKAIEGAVYCQTCAGKLLGSRNLRLRFPASHDEEEKGICRGCGETVELRAASKVIKKEKG